MAGLPIRDGLDSRSLIPLMKGDTDGWDYETISQYEKHFMIKLDALKYRYHGGQMPEVLFDSERDPAELSNLIDDAVYADAVKSFRHRLVDLGSRPNADRQYKNAGYSSDNPRS